MRRRRKEPPQVSEADQAEAAGAEDHVAWLEENEYRQQLVARAMRLIQSDFEPVTWEACWQYVALDRRPAEVAADLGLSVNSVYLAKSRVLRRLREELDGLLE